MSFKIDDILNFKNSTSSSTSSSASSVSSCSPITSDFSILSKRSFFPNAFYQAIYPHIDMINSNIFTSNQGQLSNQTRPNRAEWNDEAREKTNEFKKNSKSRHKKKKDKNEVRCEECSGNCVDIATSISSVLPDNQAQLPMCLRGSSEDQVHLATLFNSLMHHKKCRRTRTVFTDMQLIGLEKRFENQKYLSTPDRIQLAESLGLSQLQVKTWYQNRRMKWKKKVLKDGCREAPTKPKGRPKKNSIPSFSEILAAAEASGKNLCDSQSNISEESININDYSSESEIEQIDIEGSYTKYQESCENYSLKSSTRSDN